MLKKTASKIFDLLFEMWPEAHCELVHHNSFQFLLAVLLSAQTTDISVNKALAPLLKQNPQFSPQDLVDMGATVFLSHIRRIGLAPTKSKNAVATAKILVEKYHGEVPLTREDLESLPGVGRKTASVVLNELAQMPTFAVDTHVERVLKRIGLVGESLSRWGVEHAIVPLIPKKYAQNAHHVLIFHGRYCCKAKNPLCPSCKIQHLCKSRPLFEKKA